MPQRQVCDGLCPRTDARVTFLSWTSRLDGMSTDLLQPSRSTVSVLDSSCSEMSVVTGWFTDGRPAYTASTLIWHSVRFWVESPMHSGKLNLTVQFSSVLRCTLNRDDLRRSATIRRRNWRSSQVFHNRGTFTWIGQSVIGEKPATSCDDLRRPSPVQCTAENWTEMKLNSTELCRSVQLSCSVLIFYWRAILI